MASYVDGLVPEAHREAYETALRGLRARRRRRRRTQIRSVVEEELGAPIDRSVRRVGATSRSRARRSARCTARGSHDGRAGRGQGAAPGHRRDAVESDLQNAGVLEGAGRRRSVRAASTPKARLRRDQRRASARSSTTCSRPSGQTRVRARCTRAIRRSAIPGRRSRERSTRACSRPSSSAAEPRARRRPQPEPSAAHTRETLWRFVFKGNLVGGMFNADPHPGNYLFQRRRRDRVPRLRLRAADRRHAPAARRARCTAPRVARDEHDVRGGVARMLEHARRRLRGRERGVRARVLRAAVRVALPHHARVRDRARARASTD